MSSITGIFTAVGLSPEIQLGNNARIKLKFASTGTVQLLEFHNSSKEFIFTGDEFTETTVKEITGGGQRFRLSAPAVGGNIDYELIG